MTTSILNTIKKMLGIHEDDTSFDTDIIVHINSVMLTLNQNGIGPLTGFSITSSTETWSDLFGSQVNIEACKSFIYLKVKLLFDTPLNSSAIESFNRSADELLWRLLSQIETPSQEEVV